ncbi:MAG: phosphatase PAP2 family protein [Gemmatimonadaceae bacterium]
MPGNSFSLRNIFRERIDPKTYLGFHLTIGLALTAAAIWLFSALLDAVLDDKTVVHWDIAADAAIHAHTTAAGLRAVNVVTQLGSPPAMTLLGIIVAAVLWKQGHKTILIGWSAAFVGGALLNLVLKDAVHRHRPEFATAYLHDGSYSFPSGHAMGSLIGYAMLVCVAVVLRHPAQRMKRVWWTLAAAAILVIGMSRLYLGVHYPSDIAGGWAAGVACVAISMSGIGIAMQRQEDRTASRAAGQRAPLT